jgi:Flp pilus assembly protein TadG
MLKPPRLFRMMGPWITRLRVDRSGVAALEFALLLPVMLLLYFGAVELSEALTLSRKVTHVSSSLGDLVTQSKTINTTEMDNILNAAAAIMTPYSEAPLKMKVTGVKIDADGKSTVAWSFARNDTKLTKGATVTVPPMVKQPSSFIVMTEVHYAYTPMIGYVLTGSFDLTDEFYLRPRLSPEIEEKT